MKFKLLQRHARRARAAFTLAEVLAALVFMAIVIPVAVNGVRVAAFAGEIGARKAVAARIADRVLNESIITGQLQGAQTGGSVQEGGLEFKWSLRTETWTEGTLSLVTVEVTYPVQGQEHTVNLSTLVDTTTTLGTTTASP
jgi:hypothetical protein